MQVKPHIRYSQSIWVISKYWRITEDHMVLNRLLQSVTTWGMWRNSPTPTSFQGLTTPVTPIPAGLCIWTPPWKAPALEKRCVTLCVAINIAMLTCTGTSEPWKVPAADVYFAEWVCSPFSAATMFISSLTLPSAGVTQQRVGGKKMEFQRQWIH